MLHACVQKFDATRIVKKKFGTKRSLSAISNGGENRSK